MSLSRDIRKSRKSFTSRIFSRSSFVLLLFIASLWASLHFLVPRMINWDENVEELLGDFADQITIQGEQSFSTADATASIGRILLYDEDGVNYFFGDMYLKFSYLSILNLKPKVKEIVVKNAVYMFNESRKDVMPFESIRFQNSRVIWGNNSKLQNIELKDLVVKFDDGIFSKADGKVFGRQKNIYSVYLSLDQDDYDFEIKSDSSHVKYFKQGEKGHIEAGGNINDLISDFYATNSADLSFLKMNKPVSNNFSLNSDFYKSDDFYRIDNINFNSDDMVFKGNVLFSDRKFDAFLNFKKFNLNDSIDQNLFYLVFEFLGRVADSNREGGLKLKSDYLSYMDSEFTNLNIEATLKDRKFIFETFSVSAPGMTEISVNGNLTSDYVRPKFVGEVNINGDDFSQFSKSVGFSGHKLSDAFNVKSLFSLLPSGIIFKDFYSNIGDSVISGDFRCTKISKLDVSGILEFYNFDFKDGVDSVFEDLFSNRAYNIGLRLSFYDSSYKKSHIQDLSFELLVGDGYYSISDVYLNAKDANLSASFFMNDKSIIPIFNLEIVSDNFDSSIIFESSPIFNIANIKNKEKSGSGIEWSKRKFNFANFVAGGQIDLKFNNFKSPSGVLIDSLNLNADFSDNLLDLKKMSMKFGEGEVLLYGKIGMERDASMSLSVSVDNVNFNSFMPKAMKIDNIEGVFSCVGQIKSVGGSAIDIIKNMGADIKFAGKQIYVSGIDIDNTIDFLFEINNRSDLVKLMRVGVFDGGTVFDSIDGSINIDNGSAASSFSFLTSRTSGVIASNFLLKDFNTNSIAKFFFLGPLSNEHVISAEMSIQGDIWNPKIFFDNKQLYKAISDYKSNFG